MIRQHMSLSCEKAEGSGSMWVCHMRKLNNQAAWVQLSHVTNSYAVWLFSFLVRVLQKLTHAEWSIPILMWQTHMLPDHSAFSCDKLICCLIIQLTHVWVWEKNKLKSCLIIQLTHVCLFFFHCHTRKLNDQGACEFVSWEMVLLGSIWVYFLTLTYLYE
jgi:hypothetical protein